jgi:hypothetical protein
MAQERAPVGREERILAEVIDYARQSQREAARTARRDKSDTTSIWEAVR